MQKNNRREFLKKLMVGAGATTVAAASAKALTPTENGEQKQVLYKRGKAWELYYKQAK